MVVVPAAAAARGARELCTRTTRTIVAVAVEVVVAATVGLAARAELHRVVAGVDFRD